MRINVLYLILLLPFGAYGQTFSEQISKELSFEKPSPANALIIANVSGSVKVTAYEGKTIRLEAVRTINGKTDARLQAGKQEVQLAVIDRADTIILYVRDGCHDFRQRTPKIRTPLGGWTYETPGNRNCHLPYDYEITFDIKIPIGVNLLVSTINNGDVAIKGVTGSVEASNINGSIRLEDMQNQAYAHTINGDVDVEYDRNPSDACRFYTLNGDINAFFPAGLSANLSFESFNGEFFTNLKNIESLPAKIEKSGREESLHYRISGNHFKAGSGGALLDFETFNGNVYLKEKK